MKLLKLIHMTFPTLTVILMIFYDCLSPSRLYIHLYGIQFSQTLNSEYISWDKEKFLNESNESPGKYCEEGFTYNSSDNSQFLSVDEIRALIIQHVPGGGVLSFESLEI